MPSDGTSTDPQTPTTRPERATDAAAPFPYLRWAKAHLDPESAPAGSANLGLSGVAILSAEERARLGMTPTHGFGTAHDDLKRALAARYGLTPDHVHPAAGTSHANFMVFLALARGGGVAVETPAYEALPRLAQAVSATAASFPRDPARAWRIDAAGLAASVSADTGLIAVTDLHNPSGARLHTDDLDLLIAAAEEHDAYVLVDEVYADFDPDPRPTAARRHRRVVTTNSLTKVYGFPDLRAGWILGDPEVIRRIDAWDDLVHPVKPPAPMAEAAAFIPQAPARLAPLIAEAAARAEQVDRWVRSTPRVSWTRPVGGITGLLWLEGVHGDGVAEAAWRDHHVQVVPGSFFQADHAVRVSFHLEPDALDTALAGLARAIEACA